MQDHTFKKVIVSDTATPGSNYAPEKIALFDETGQRVSIPSQASLNSQFTPWPQRAARPQIASYIERFQASHGWTVLGGGASLTDNTTDYIIGTQCTTFQTRTDGVNRSVDKDGYSADSTGYQLALTFKIADVTNITEVLVYAGDTSFANYWQWTVHGDTLTDQQRWFKSGEWVTMVLNFGSAAKIGTPTRTLQKIRVRVGASNGAAATTVSLGGIGLVVEPSAWPNGVVSLTFDDLYVSNWTQARKKMSEAGLVGTVYAISNRIGTYMTLQQLRDLEKLGWEIAVHGENSLGGMTLAEAEADVLREKSTLAAYGFRGVDHYAYPGGVYTPEIIEMLRKYFTTARTICYRSHETIRPADPMRLRAISPGNLTAASAVTDAITAAKTYKAWQIVTIHDVDPTAALGTQWSVSNFGTMIDHIVSQGIPCRTVSDVIGSL